MLLNLHQDVWRRGEVYTGFWLGNLRDKGHLKDLDVDGRIILSGMWNESSWIRTRTGDGAFVNAVMNMRVP